MIARFFVRYVLPIIAAALFVVAVMHVRQSSEEKGTKPKPVNEPPKTPFKNTVAGSGLIEAQTQNIAIGSQAAGVVEEVFVKVGDRVKAKTPLFRLRDTSLKAQLEIRRAALAAAEAELNRLEKLPREEEIPVKQALVEAAEAVHADRKRKLAKMEAAFKTQAVTDDEVETARNDLATATAELHRAKADLALLKAGASKYEKAVALAAVKRAESEVAEIETSILLLSIYAAVDGEVLQVNVRPGEFVGTTANQPLVLLGSTVKLHVRVDIDEQDIPRFQQGAKAIAMLKGYPDLKFRLTFKRVEPYVIPKRSLTGENTERIDTRVLQVIYEITSHSTPLYVGQQMDVFIEVPDNTRKSDSK